jgi:serine/threonine protein kinase
MIAEHEDLTSDEDDDRNPVDILADEFSERLRNGENPSITEYVRRRPDLEEDIRELFPTISMMEQFRKKQQVDTQLTQQSARLDAERLKQLGDFRVIREVGRGGMGVVYAAEQQSLKRFVALKVLAPNVTGSENELRRFKREAEAAARLHHTNIVPIFGTGESDGLHFIVMQLVDGVPLHEAIESVLIDSESTERLGHNDPSSHDSFTAAMAASALRTGSTLQPTAASIATSLKPEAPMIQTPLHKPPGIEKGSGTRHTKLTMPSTASILGPVKRDQPSSPLLDDHNAVEDTDEPSTSLRPTAVRRNLGRRYWNSSAGIVAEIADALAYAHEQGVVHRDVKPSNILFDRAGAVWITDFGLARHEDQEAVTRTGDIIGTLRYMAPEQCNGVGNSRSDVYSLGLTLYELITLQPAFPEARHGVLIQQKHDGAFPRPRSIDSSIPRDLETITLKACSTDPAHRYQTATEFATDLRNFMDEMPVQARPITLAERLWRWSRRNPVTAALSGLSFALLIAVAAVTAVGNYRTGLALADAQRERKNAESERNLAQTERNNAQTERNKAIAAATKAQKEEEHAKQESERAEANLQIAVRAFEEIIANIASRGIPQSMTFASAENGNEDSESGEPPATSSDAVVTQADAELLESLLRFFDEFASRNSADLQAQSADARRIIGDIHQRLGRLDDAADGYREALKIVESLAEASPENTDLILKRVRILNDLGVTLSRRGSFREPYELHQRAQKLISESEELMASKEGRFALAETHNLMASIGSRTGVTRLYAALSSDGSFRPPGRRRPSRPSTTTTPNTTGSQTANAQAGNSQSDSSQTQSTQGTGRSRSGGSQVRRILDSYEQAVAILTELIAQEPSSGRFRLALAQCFRNRMAFSRMIGHRSLERESLEESIQYLDDLTRDFPNAPVYQFELADTLCLNVTRAPGERDAEYEERVRRAVSICKTLMAAYPTFAEYRALMATSLSRLAAIHRSGGEIDVARSTLLEALAIQRELTAEYDSVSSYRILYIYTVMSLRDLEATSGTPEAAEEFRKIAVDFLTRQLAKRESRAFRSILMRLQPPEPPKKTDS